MSTPVYKFSMDERPDVGAARLARELRTAREASGRSLRDVARGADISAAYLQKLERGQVTEPSPNILRRLAAALGLKYVRLMETAGYGTPRPRGTDGPLNARLAAASLTEVEERSVAAFVEHLISARPD